MISFREQGRAKHLTLILAFLLLAAVATWLCIGRRSVESDRTVLATAPAAEAKVIIPAPLDSHEPGPTHASASALPSRVAVLLGEAEKNLEALPDDARRVEYLQGVLREAVALSPRETADWAAGLRVANLRDVAVAFVLMTWGYRDAPAALAWAVDHPRADNDATRLFAAFEGFADRDPLGALRWMQRSELAGDADALSRIAIFHAETSGRLSDVRAEIEKLPEGNVRDLLTRQVMTVWAKQSPVAAANWLASTSTDANFRAGMGALVQTLVAHDPAFAAGLTQQFADGQIREQYLADVVYLWARRDLGGAATWLRAQPPGQHLDAAIARIAEATAGFDRVEAAAWIDTIRDSRKRDELRQRLKIGG
jgi:hypothetical protein